MLDAAKCWHVAHDCPAVSAIRKFGGEPDRTAVRDRIVSMRPLDAMFGE